MAITLPDAWITTRRTAWACCAGDADYAAVVAWNNGDRECYAKKLKEAEFMLWAYQQLLATPTSTEDAAVKCVTHDQACAIAQLADPLCTRCGCVPEVADPPGDCVIPAITITAFLAAEDATTPPPGSPVAGDTYVITTFGGVPTTALVLVWDGSAYSSATNAVAGTIYYDGATYMLVVPDPLWGVIVQDLFPSIIVSEVVPGTYTVISSSPAVALAEQRIISIEATGDGSTWVQVAGLPELDIAALTTIYTFPAVPNPIAFRITYYDGACSYGPFGATLNNTPPLNYIWFGTSAVPNSGLRRGDMAGPVPFAVMDGVANPPTSNIVRVRRDQGAQNLGALVYTGQGVTPNIVLRTSYDDGTTWGDPGGNWTTSPFAVGPQIGQSVHWAVEDNSVCLVCGNTKSLHMSVDGGLTFNYVNLSDGIEGGAEEFMYAVAYSGSEFIVGTRRSIWKTSDGGASWTKTMNQLVDNPGALLLNLTICDDAVIAFMDIGYRRSADRGVTWAPVNAAVVGTIWMDADVYPRVGAVAKRIFTSSGQISDDNGLTWSTPPAIIVGAGPTITAMSHDIAYLGNLITYDGFASATPLFPPFPNGPTANDPPWSVEGKIFP